MEDLTVRRITKKVFPYLWLRHKLMSSIPPAGTFPYNELAVFSQLIGNTVLVYLHMYRPTLSKYLEKHIPSMPKQKVHFWTHVAFLCLKVRLTEDDVFDYFLTTCALTAEVAIHCHLNGYDDVLSLASMFFCAFFENELYEGFHSAGGWLGLHRYIRDTSCHELYKSVDGYVKELESPIEQSPVLITTQYEPLAAGRREKLICLLSFKIGEIERDSQPKLIVKGIVQWDFMENQRISEVKPGILKRMENIRKKMHKSNLTMDKETDYEYLSVCDAEYKNSKGKLPHHHDEAQSLVSIEATVEPRDIDKNEPTLNEAECTEIKEESEEQLRANNKTPEQTKFSSSSSFSKLRDYFENLSASPERTMDNLKRFGNNSRTRDKIESSTNKNIAKRQEKVNHSERRWRYVSSSNENGGEFSKDKTFTPESVTKPTESFHVDDALSEFTKSFQELGFKCLCVGRSSQSDAKSTTIMNYAEIMEKCRYFQNKYSSIQFAILIPNDYFADETSHDPETEKDDEIRPEEQYGKQMFSDSISKEDFENVTVLGERVQFETKNSRFDVSKEDENQFWLTRRHALFQNSAAENIQKFRFSSEENNLMSRSETSEVNENQMMSKYCTTEPTTISSFTVTKVNESQSTDGTSILQKTNDNTKISRLTAPKVNEDHLKDGTSIVENNWTNEATNKSIFTVTKVNENQLKDATSILRKNGTNETPKLSRFTTKKFHDNQLVSQAGTSSLRKGYSTNTTKISRSAVTKVDGSQTTLLERNRPVSSEISDDTGNESIHFQDNGSVKYQKRVSFADYNFINYYQPYASNESLQENKSVKYQKRVSFTENPFINYYSSDESPNSRISQENLGQNSPEDSSSSRNHGLEDTSSVLTLKNPTVSETRRRIQSFGDSQSSTNNTRNSKTSSGLCFFGKCFSRSNSRNSKMNKSQVEETDEVNESQMEETGKGNESQMEETGKGNESQMEETGKGNESQMEETGKWNESQM